MADLITPAFPTGTGVTPYKSGMTLRDYFAAKVLQTYMMHEVWKQEVYEYAATEAYKVADAMMKAREA